MTATAAILFRTGEPLEVHGGIELAPPNRGQVRVRLAYSGVCHSQVMEVKGGRGVDRYLPHMLGHEGTGHVEAVGDGVDKVEVGDRVVLGWIRSDGQDAAGSIHRLGHQDINAGPVTTFATHAVVAENRCVKLPPWVPMDVGALFGCALLTGAGLVNHEADPAPGATVAIFGLGGIGLSALLACRMRNDLTVYAVDVEAPKLALAKQFGAAAAINAVTTDPVERLRGLTGGRGVDIAIEAAGRSRTIEQAFESSRRGGLTVFASHPAAGETVSLDPYELIAGKRIKGSWGGAARPDIDIPWLADAYLAGRLPLDVFIAQRYPLDRINDAIDDLANRRAIRPLIVIDPTLT